MSAPGTPRPSPALRFDVMLSDLDVAWQERDDEAKVLMAQGHHSMALALRLYSLEIRIKALICKRLNLTVLPRACITHDLSVLIVFTGTWEELTDPAKSDIRRNWDKIADYSANHLNDLRYLPRSKLDAAKLNELLQALDDPTEGVLPWLSKHP